MLKLAGFYIKVLLKTPLFFISLLFSIFIFIVQLGSIKYSSILLYTNVSCYAMISLNLYFLISTSSVLAKKYEIMEFLELDRFKKYFIIILSSMIISITISLIPIIFILIFKNTNISLYFVIKGIINFFIILNLSNLLSISIGASIGSLFKSWISIIISVIIYGFFPFYLFNPLTESMTINKFLNIYGDSTITPTNILSDEIFNISYFCDKLFIILIVILLILLVKILMNKNKRVLSMISALLVILCMIVTTLVANNGVSVIHEYDSSKAGNFNYHISSYKMDISMANNFRNNVSFQLEIDKPNESIVLLLDDLFKINEIKVNNIPVKFTHNNDEILLDYEVSNKDIVNVSISYEGDIYVEDDLGVDTFYCTNHAINLTDSFRWYPCVENDNYPINYSVNIDRLYDIYSNLNTQPEGNKYLLEGTAKKVSLFSGAYKDVIDDGIEYIIPSAYNFENFKNSLDEYIMDSVNNSQNEFSENDISTLKEKKYKKVIVGIHVNNYTAIKLSDDVLLFEL